MTLQQEQAPLEELLQGRVGETPLEESEVAACLLRGATGKSNQKELQVRRGVSGGEVERPFCRGGRRFPSCRDPLGRGEADPRVHQKRGLFLVLALANSLAQRFGGAPRPALRLGLNTRSNVSGA